jgi:hypothetical protein
MAKRQAQDLADVVDDQGLGGSSVGGTGVNKP